MQPVLAVNGDVARFSLGLGGGKGEIKGVGGEEGLRRVWGGKMLGKGGVPGVGCCRR